MRMASWAGDREEADDDRAGESNDDCGAGDDPDDEDDPDIEDEPDGAGGEPDGEDDSTST